MLVGRLLSSGPHPCEPCALHSFRWGLHWLPFFVFPHHPSWTCGGEKSPVHCGVVKSERLRGHSSPGNWWWFPCCPSWGWLWKNPVAAVASATLGFAIWNPRGLLGRKPKTHLFVGVQHQRRDECLFQASSTAIAHVIMHDYYVIQVGEVVPPHIGAEGQKDSFTYLSHRLTCNCHRYVAV